MGNSKLCLWVENVYVLVIFNKKYLGRIQAVKRCLLVEYGQNEVLFVCRVGMDKTLFVYGMVLTPH